MAEEPRPEEGLTQAELSPVVKDVEDNAEKRPVYEVGFHIVPQVGDDNATAVVVEKVRAAIGDAEFISEGSPRKMRLAYTVERSGQGKREKFSESYFGWIKFEAPIAIAQTIEAFLKHNKSFFRYIVFQTVREDTRAKMKAPQLREVKRTDVIRQVPKRIEETSAPVSEEELEKALSDITSE